MIKIQENITLLISISMQCSTITHVKILSPIFILWAFVHRRSAVPCFRNFSEILSSYITMSANSAKKLFSGQKESIFKTRVESFHNNSRSNVSKNSSYQLQNTRCCRLKISSSIKKMFSYEILSNIRGHC